MAIALFSTLVDSLVALIAHLGYFGIFIGMAIESSFIPLPSEVVLIPAGVLIANGQLSFFPTFIAGVLGSLAGSLFSYFIGLSLGRKTVEFLVDKYGKFLFFNSKNLRKTDSFYKQHGEITTFIGRLVFVVRHFISLPAGFARMNIFRFSLFTVLGASIWVTLLLIVGMFFGHDAISPAAKQIAAILFVACLVLSLLYYYKHQKKSEKDDLEN